MRFIKSLSFLFFVGLFSASLLLGAKPKITQTSSHSIEAMIADQSNKSASYIIAAGENANFHLAVKRNGQSIPLSPSDYQVSGTKHIGPVPFRVVTPATTADGSSILKQGDELAIQWSQSPQANRTIPRALVPVIRSMISNWSSVRDQYDVATYPGDYLIITDDAYLNYLGDYVDWKTSQGYHVTVKGLSEVGTTAPEIRSAIQAEYEASHGQLAYVLLVGDADNGHPDNVNMVPAFYYASPTTGDQNVTDHPYALMDDDEFSDLFVGRFSVDSVLELVTMLNKVLHYEKTPPSGDWEENALLIAGNYSNTPPNPITPIWTTRWLRQKLLDYGYSNVDTVFYPPTQLGQQTIADIINDGVGIVNYRGWADANGWQYPQFKISDMTNLINNAPMTPIITSIVCNTGDFANSIDPVYGEQWMRLGTPTNPKGATGFFGPSDLHTSTKFNNSICSGFYEGLLEEGIHNFGAAAYRGKIQLYTNFPLERGNDEWVEFYFHVYNILGDPSTEIRTKRAEEPNVDLSNEMAAGATTLTLHLDNDDIEDYTTVYATLISSEDTTGSYFDKSGSATLAFKPLQSDATITISGPNIEPQIETIAPSEQNIYASVVNLAVTGTPKPGQTVTIVPTVKNSGRNDLSNVTFELQPVDGIIISGPSSFTVNSISSGSEFTPDNGITMEIAPDYVHVSPQQLIWRVFFSGAVWTVGAELEIPNTLFDVITILNDSDQPFVSRGETTSLHFNLDNVSHYNSENGSVSVSSPDDGVIVSGEELSFNAIPADSSSDVISGLEVTVPTDIPNGSSVTLVFSLTESDGRHYEVRKMLTVGPIQVTDPIGPDNYGYFAYDNSDSQYDAAPTNETYRTIGNSAVLHSLGDDENAQISLPWEFQYYGTSYDAVTVSSNGWISFLPEDLAYFRNWPIPSPLGPKGLVAGYWDDLDAPNNEQMEVYTENAGDEFVITWSKSYANYDEVTPEKFQIVMKKTAAGITPTGDDEILFLYNDVADVDQSNNYSTIGIEAPGKRVGLQYLYAGQYTPGAAVLESGRAVLFTTRRPAGFIVNTADEPGLPQHFRVSQNYPNPFNPSTTFSIDIPFHGDVKVVLYNIKGERVWEQTVANASPGHYPVRWNGKTFSGNAPSGIYFARVQFYSGESMKQQTIKMTLLR